MILRNYWKHGKFILLPSLILTYLLKKAEGTSGLSEIFMWKNGEVFIFSSLSGFKVYDEYMFGLNFVLWGISQKYLLGTYFSIHSCNVSMKKIWGRIRGHALAGIKEKRRKTVVTKKSDKAVRGFCFCPWTEDSSGKTSFLL